MKLLKITPEGEFSYVETSRENFLLTCHREIGCTCIEMPPLMNLPKRYQMIVDESGLFKKKPKANMLPWFWYSNFNEMAPIVGADLFDCFMCAFTGRKINISTVTLVPCKIYFKHSD